MADTFQELIEQVKNRAGIPEDKARTAVDAVVGYIKQKSPTVGNQLEGFVKGGGGDFTDNVKNKFGL